MKAGLRLDSRAACSPAAKPDRRSSRASDESLLLQALRHEDGLEMPPDKPKLARRDHRRLRDVGGAGRADPAARTHGRASRDADEARRHWAFQPVRKAGAAAREGRGLGRNPDRRFRPGEARGAELAPAPEADRADWIRRVTFDLTGLPPTPEEVEAFVNDASPDAYERLVDRLLA